jgi:membrane protease YdiL (CAAX protease family)
MPTGALVRMALGFYGLLAAAAWLWTWLAGERLVWLSAPPGQAGVTLARDTGLGLGFGLALVAASRLALRSSASARALSERLAALLGRPSTPACLLLAVVSGVGEEAFFRGALQPQLGVVLASGVFALAHLVPRREFAAWPIFAFAAGLGFGALFSATDALLAPALAHATVNAVNLRWLASRGASQ